MKNNMNFIKLGFTVKQRKLHTLICQIADKSEDHITEPEVLFEKVKDYLKSHKTGLQSCGYAYIDKACQKYMNMSEKSDQEEKYE